MKTLVAFLILVGVLATLNFTSSHRDLNNYWKGCPNVTKRVEQLDEKELLNSPKFREQIAAINAELPIVVVN